MEQIRNEKIYEEENQRMRRRMMLRRRNIVLYDRVLTCSLYVL